MINVALEVALWQVFYSELNVKVRGRFRYACFCVYCECCVHDYWGKDLCDVQISDQICPGFAR